MRVLPSSRGGPCDGNPLANLMAAAGVALVAVGRPQLWHLGQTARGIALPLLDAANQPGKDL